MVAIKTFACSVSKPRPGQTTQLTVTYDTGYWWGENTQAIFSYIDIEGNSVPIWKGNVSGNPGTNTATKPFTIPMKVGDQVQVTVRVSKGADSDVDYKTISIPIAIRQPTITATASDYTPRPDSQVSINVSGVVGYVHTNAQVVLTDNVNAPITKNVSPSSTSGAYSCSIPLQVTNDQEGSSIPVTVSLYADDPVMGPGWLLVSFNLTLDVVRMLKCQYCSSKFETQAQLDAHLAASHGYVCTYCGASFATQGLLSAHIGQAHPPVEEYYCDICGAGPFSTPYALQSHRDTHDVFTCEQCGATFTTQAALNGHIANAHATQYTCPVCQSVFTTQAALTSHINSAHSNQYICATCGWTFSSAAALQEHMASAHPTEPVTTDWSKYIPYIAVGGVGVVGLIAAVMIMRRPRDVRSN